MKLDASRNSAAESTDLCKQPHSLTPIKHRRIQSNHIQTYYIVRCTAVLGSHGTASSIKCFSTGTTRLSDSLCGEGMGAERCEHKQNQTSVMDIRLFAYSTYLAMKRNVKRIN